MIHKIDNYGNKVEWPHIELVSDYTPAQLVAAGYDLWDFGGAFVASGVNSDVFSGDYELREAVVNSGRHLDILIYDKSDYIRAAVARQGYGLDILIHDKNWYVRVAIAKQGYSLDILIHDKNWLVRKAVADQGYGLNILVNDRHRLVRKAVANQGYGLDILVNDKVEYISEIAKQKLVELES